MNEIYYPGRLAEDLRALVSDAEGLLRATTNAGRAELQRRARATQQDLRARYNSTENQLRDRAREVGSYVRENPWQSVAAVGGATLLLGLLMGLIRR
jgi:ElaB/YqjD/DUF883 family membrane-anchored ribosome-binding protein